MAGVKNGNRRKNSLPYFQNVIERSGHSSRLNEYMSVRFESSQDLYRVDLRGHYGCVNAIEFSNKGGEFVVSGGDDRRVLLWNLEKTLYRKEEPAIMKGQHRSNIFCTVFDSDNRHLFSAGNDDQALRHDILTRETLGVYFHDHPVYGLNIHPEQENIFLTACDNGKVQLWDARNTSQSASQCLAHYHRSAFHAAVFNPVEPILIATANSMKGVQLWDVRFPERVLCEFRNAMHKDKVCAMGVKWNSTGTRLSALRRRLPPVLYSIEQTTALAEFKHPGYNNICTMKSHCFAGDKDQYIISGSDDFNVYLWKVPDLPSKTEKVVTVNKAMLVLSGHRSIVNQVRFNPTTHTIISAGVEKIIKVWSPWYLPGAKGSIHKKKQPSEINKRELYSHDDYVDLVLDSGQPLTHEYEGGSVDEDPRMLAFFDTLIQREQGGWNSDSDSNISEDDFYSRFLDIRSSDVSDSDSDRVSAHRLRDIFGDEERNSDESDETSQAVIRRMRRLRRAAFLRGLVRASGQQEDDEQEDTDDQSHPSNSSNAFIRHLTREIMREALESSSESSDHDSEATVTVALPEEFLQDNDNNNTSTERVEFRPTRSRRARQYRTRRDSSQEGSPQATSSANGATIQNETDLFPPQGRKRRESSSSSSEDDSHEDECRTSQLHVNSRRKRTRIHDQESDEEQTNGGPSLFPSTSQESSCSVENVAARHVPSCVCAEHLTIRQIGNHDHENHSTLNEDSAECRLDVEGGHESVNHNGHRHDGHHNHSQTSMAHSSTEPGENVSLDGQHDDFNNT